MKRVCCIAAVIIKSRRNLHRKHCFTSKVTFLLNVLPLRVPIQDYLEKKSVIF